MSRRRSPCSAAATSSAPAAPGPPRTWSWRLVVARASLLVALLVGVVVLVFESFGGAFSTYAVAQAQLPASSTAVALGRAGRVSQRDRGHGGQPGQVRSRRPGRR